MADKFAPEAPVKDARVQEFAYNASEMIAVLLKMMQLKQRIKEQQLKS